MSNLSAVLVTGASSGIGAATAKLLLESGRPVACVARRGDLLQSMYGHYPHACILPADLVAPDGVETVCQAVTARLGALGGLVHCAGFDAMAPLGLISVETLRALYEIHVVAAIRLLAWLAKKSNHVPGASCVLISSQAAHEEAPGHIAYAAAKGAIEGMFPSLAAELKARGIGLHLITPGVVKTPMSTSWLSKLPPAARARIESQAVEPLLLAQQIVSFLVPPEVKTC